MHWEVLGTIKWTKTRNKPLSFAAVEREGKYQGEPSVGGLNLSTKSFWFDIHELMGLFLLGTDYVQAFRFVKIRKIPIYICKRFDAQSNACFVLLGCYIWPSLPLSLASRKIPSFGANSVQVTWR